MHIQKAFYHAVAHGYRLPGKVTHFGGANAEYSVWIMPETQSSLMIPVQETFLDPRFWQSLGQALGWERPCQICFACSQEDACAVWDGYYWMYQWHCFIHHLAEGKTAESFFATLSPTRWSPKAPAPGPQPSIRREKIDTRYIEDVLHMEPASKDFERKYQELVRHVRHHTGKACRERREQPPEE